MVTIVVDIEEEANTKGAVATKNQPTMAYRNRIHFLFDNLPFHVVAKEKENNVTTFAVKKLLFYYVFVKSEEPEEIREDNTREFEKVGGPTRGGGNYSRPGYFENKDGMSEKEMEWIPARDLKGGEEKRPEKHAQDQAFSRIMLTSNSIFHIFKVLCGYAMSGTHEAAI